MRAAGQCPCPLPRPAAARQLIVPACSWYHSAAAGSGQALIGPACAVQAVQKRAAGGRTPPHQTLLVRDMCMYQPGRGRQLAAGTTLPRLTAHQGAQTAGGAGCITWPACRQVCLVSMQGFRVWVPGVVNFAIWQATSTWKARLLKARPSRCACLTGSLSLKTPTEVDLMAFSARHEAVQGRSCCLSRLHWGQSAAMDIPVSEGSPQLLVKADTCRAPLP